MESAKREKAEYTASSTPINKWLMVFTKFMETRELTTDMAKFLIEKVEVINRDRVSITYKFRDEFMAIIKYVGEAAA